MKWHNAGLISQSPQFDSEPTQQTLSTGPFTNLNVEGERYIPPLLKEEKKMKKTDVTIEINGCLVLIILTIICITLMVIFA